MKQIPVRLGKRSYRITIGRGALNSLPAVLNKSFPSKKNIVLTDRTVGRLYRAEITKKLGKLSWIEIPPGERHKNLKTVEAIFRKMVAEGNRKTGLIALGGGVVGDVGGFVAATFMRGIPYIQVPTTLLAQVDSSVGGKTGVDLPEGKNLVGAFYQPRAVVIDTRFLATLPRREFLCGLAEVVKYGVLWDERFFSFIEKNVGKILSLNHNVLESLIARSCAIKAEIVSKDEKELALRSLLNLGHTMGHAIETLSGYGRIRHGEAVSRGIVYAARLSFARDLCSQNDWMRIVSLFLALGLPVKMPSYPASRYRKVIASDKKASGKKINYIGIQKIGRAVILPLTPEEITGAL
ncbi:MAG: 3-dehydroquinate synthase [Deltaproteobacteria bacterium]|nr:3-dehydroquinate synthase [Deltaproteobacteria bacterium]